MRAGAVAIENASFAIVGGPIEQPVFRTMPLPLKSRVLDIERTLFTKQRRAIVDGHTLVHVRADGYANGWLAGAGYVGRIQIFDSDAGLLGWLRIATLAAVADHLRGVALAGWTRFRLSRSPEQNDRALLATPYRVKLSATMRWPGRLPARLANSCDALKRCLKYKHARWPPPVRDVAITAFQRSGEHTSKTRIDSRGRGLDLALCTLVADGHFAAEATQAHRPRA